MKKRFCFLKFTLLQKILTSMNEEYEILRALWLEYFKKVEIENEALKKNIQQLQKQNITLQKSIANGASETCSICRINGYCSECIQYCYMCHDTSIGKCCICDICNTCKKCCNCTYNDYDENDDVMCEEK